MANIAVGATLEKIRGGSEDRDGAPSTASDSAYRFGFGYDFRILSSSPKFTEAFTEAASADQSLIGIKRGIIRNGNGGVAGN